MKFTQKDEYTIDVDTVFNAFSDPDFLKARSETIGARNISIEASESDGTVTVNVMREMPSDAPSKLKKFIPAWSKAVQTEIWKGSAGGPYMGTAEVHPEGVPATIKSKMKLAAKGDGCLMQINTEVKSSIPFVGGSLAKFVGETAQKTLASEYAYNQENIG